MAHATTERDLHTDSRDGRRDHIRTLAEFLQRQSNDYEAFGFVKQAIAKIEAREYVQALDLLRNISTGSMSDDDKALLEHVKDCLPDMQNNKKEKEQKRR